MRISDSELRFQGFGFGVSGFGLGAEGLYRILQGFYKMLQKRESNLPRSSILPLNPKR